MSQSPNIKALSSPSAGPVRLNGPRVLHRLLRHCQSEIFYFEWGELPRDDLRPARFELAACGFEVQCSIQLSYGRTAADSDR